MLYNIYVSIYLRSIQVNRSIELKNSNIVVEDTRSELEIGMPIEPLDTIDIIIA